MIKNGYGEKLLLVNKIEVYGKQWSIYYNYMEGYMSHLSEMLHCFKVVEDETIILIIDEGSVLHCRIYQNDGKEIDYGSRITGDAGKKSGQWIWALWPTPSVISRSSGRTQTNEEIAKEIIDISDDDTKSGEHDGGPETEMSNPMDDAEVVVKSENKGHMEHGNHDLMEEDVVEDCALDVIKFSAKLKPSNADKSTHGVRIPKDIKPRGRDWEAGERVKIITKMKLVSLDMTFSKVKTFGRTPWNLLKVHPSIEQLSQLCHLDLNEVGHLRELPETVAQLTKLGHLDLRGCHSLKRLPEPIKLLYNFECLNIGGCSDLSNSIWKLKLLKILRLSGTSKLERLPEQFQGRILPSHIFEGRMCERGYNLSEKWRQN
ncbi:hypothetical protein AgCh_015047 [Apium graveolens]